MIHEELSTLLRLKMLSKKFNQAGISFTSDANREMDFEEDEEEDGGGRGGRYPKKNITKLKCPRVQCSKAFIYLCEQVPQHAAEERAEAEPDVRDRAAGHAAEGGAAEAEEGRHLQRRREGGRRR